MQAREQFVKGGRFRVVVTGGLVVGAAYRGVQTLFEDETPNLVVNAGRTYGTGVELLGVTAITTWYLALINATATIAAADTMASHGGWTELTGYSQATRPTWVGVAGGAAGSATNTASPGSFSINTGSLTLGGLFLASNATKGGTTGTLFAASASASFALPNPSTVTVTYDFGW